MAASCTFVECKCVPSARQLAPKIWVHHAKLEKLDPKLIGIKYESVKVFKIGNCEV